MRAWVIKISSGFNKWEIIILICGVFIMLVRYINYSPIFHDEAARMLTVQQTSLWDLIRSPRLDNYVHDAKGFLAMIKIFSCFFPIHELSFRFPVFLCALLGCVLFFRLAHHLLAPAGRYVAMGLYIICPFLIGHSSIMLPYACNVFVSNLLLLMFYRLISSDLHRVEVRLGYALLGGLAAVLSIPAVFILAGCGSIALIHMLILHETDKLKRFLPIVIFWMITWAVHYFYYIRDTAQWLALSDQWQPYLLPFKDGLGTSVAWFFLKFAQMFDHPVGMVAGLGLPLWALGIMAFLKKDRLHFFQIISPFFLMLIAVLIRKYPFHGRVLAFLLPINLLIIGQGYQYCVERMPKGRFSQGFVFFAGCLMLIHPLRQTWTDLHYSHRNGHVPAAMNTIRTHWQPGDGIYIHANFLHDFRFLNQRYRFRPQDYRQGVGRTSTACAAEIKKLPGYDRIWFILRNDTQEGVRVIRFYADHQGKLIYGQGCGACYLYLYEWDSKKGSHK